MSATDPGDRVVRIGDLVTLGEIAMRTGMGRAAVSNWRSRHADFPDPVYELSEGARRSPLFLWPEVAEWLDGRCIPHVVFTP